MGKVPTLTHDGRSLFEGATFNVVMYCFLGVFKIVFLVFSLIPYLALRIIG